MDIRTTIERAFEQPVLQQHEKSVRDAIEECFALLECGELRAAEPTSEGWRVNQWVKKAILLSFRVFANQKIDNGWTSYYDKVDTRYRGYSEQSFVDEQVRIVPPAVARRATYLGPNVVLMPSFVNIGAYVDEGTMVDTWSTVGSCAQIGKRVHLSGGVGIGGVLEPLQANPTIIEDDCFIGARSEIVEGVIVEKGSVISMGVYLGQSTRIYNRMTKKISYGTVPAGSVVVPGSLPASDGTHSLAAAIIVKTVDMQTRAKVGINELLRSSE